MRATMFTLAAGGDEMLISFSCGAFAILIVIVLVCVACVSDFRNWKRQQCRRERRCERCDYDLRGADHERCPECGGLKQQDDV